MPIYTFAYGCRKAATLLEKLALKGAQSYQAHLCARALQEIGDNASQYDEVATVSRPFLDEIHTTTKRLSQAESLEPGDGFDEVFALFEAASVVIREYVKWHSYKAMNPVQGEVCHHFESSGHWLPEDTEMAAFCYFVKIPMSVASALRS